MDQLATGFSQAVRKSYWINPQLFPDLLMPLFQIPVKPGQAVFQVLQPLTVPILENVCVRIMSGFLDFVENIQPAGRNLNEADSAIVRVRIPLDVIFGFQHRDLPAGRGQVQQQMLCQHIDRQRARVLQLAEQKILRPVQVPESGAERRRQPDQQGDLVLDHIQSIFVQLPPPLLSLNRSHKYIIPLREGTLHPGAWVNRKNVNRHSFMEGRSSLGEVFLAIKEWFSSGHVTRRIQPTGCAPTIRNHHCVQEYAKR